MKKITVKTPQKQFCVHAVIMKSCTYNRCMYKNCFKDVSTVVLFYKSHPKCCDRSVLYCKSGHNFSDNFNKIIKKGPNLEKWN